VTDPESGEKNGHRPPAGHSPPEGSPTRDGPRHALNGNEVAAASKVEERFRLESKPILEWSRDDWQLWAAGLDQAKDEPVQPEPVALQDTVQPEPVHLEEPVQPEPVDSLDDPVQPEPVQPEPVQAEPVQAEPVPPEPVRHEPAPANANVSVDLATEATVQAEASPVDAPTVETASATVETASATSQPAAQDVAFDVPETPATIRPEPSAATLRLSPDLTDTRHWGERRHEAPVRTAARTPVRSAMGLLVLALAVGTAVAGLVTFIVIMVGLVLRRALGA